MREILRRITAAWRLLLTGSPDRVTAETRAMEALAAEKWQRVEAKMRECDAREAAMGSVTITKPAGMSDVEVYEAVSREMERRSLARTGYRRGLL